MARPKINKVWETFFFSLNFPFSDMAKYGTWVVGNKSAESNNQSNSSVEQKTKPRNKSNFCYAHFDWLSHKYMAPHHNDTHYKLNINHGFNFQNPTFNGCAFIDWTDKIFRNFLLLSFIGIDSLIEYNLEPSTSTTSTNDNRSNNGIVLLSEQLNMFLCHV